MSRYDNAPDPFNKPIKVCRHLKKKADRRMEIEPVPYVIGITDDYYTCSWLCKDCIEKYNVPKQGVFLFHLPSSDDGDEHFGFLRNLNLDLNDIEGCFDILGFKNSGDLYNNPFETVEGELTVYLDLNTFFLLSGITPVTKDVYVRETLKVPFGSELTIK
ncbi:hypothetical protein ACSFVZ_07255 [Pseudoalteromonas sp. SYSU M81236]|jgi:hypothetical protein|uniref:hypothetical protein n=1 Tax=Pseudoalteromonas sp. SYSU M81236 TaxID=3447014 RepID=UPI003F021973